MEWVVLVALALAAAALVALPGGGPRPASIEDAMPEDEAVGLAAERQRLLAELRELDDDAQVGRISAGDRMEGRRALAPRLRAATEALRALAGPEGGQ